MANKDYDGGIQNFWVSVRWKSVQFEYLSEISPGVRTQDVIDVLVCLFRISLEVASRATKRLQQISVQNTDLAGLLGLGGM